MDILELREYCLALPLAEETTPFDEMTLVYKVAGVDPRFLSVGGEFPAACQAGNAVAAVGGGQNINPGLRTIQNRQS